MVPGLSELVFARGSEGLKTRRAIGEDRAIKGRHCEFIRLCNLPQCQNGQKFLVQVVLKSYYFEVFGERSQTVNWSLLLRLTFGHQGEQGVRRQFLLTNEGNIVIFLTRCDYVFLIPNERA